MPTPLELLAPARDLEIARQAILHGADAIYMGGPSHGARAAATNSIADLRAAAACAHSFGARLYVTLNTIIYDDELEAVEREVWDLWDAGADALIVQDMALLRMHLPPIELHASTQCDIRTPAKARFLADCGFTQLVLPREFDIEEIKAARDAVPAGVSLEAFVHGALCVSYSGDCQASCAANGRSANRGECAQMCRMAYDLVDAEGRVLMPNSHLLSLRDLCRIDDIEAMANAGISSFKIEGRLKDTAYVKTVVTAYRRALDKIIDANPGRYSRSSLGRCLTSIDPDVNRAFNRGFTPYFLHGAPPRLLSNDGATPKYIGEPVAKAAISSASPNGRSTSPSKRIHKEYIPVTYLSPGIRLNNGDGLGYFDRNRQFRGFRLNRVDGDRLYPASAVDLPPGTMLYRNSDAKRDAAIAADRPERLIDLDMTLRLAPGGIALTVETASHRCTATAACSPDKAKSDQSEARRCTLSKLGGTVFSLRSLTDNISPDAFIQASVLTALRREAVELMATTIQMGSQRPCRRQESPEAAAHPSLSYHDNVSNRLARQFYLDHGAHDIAPALEIRPPKGETAVMTMRYCLRRELGACLREKGAGKLPTPLYLKNKAATYRLDFDCKNCRMRLIANSPF